MYINTFEKESLALDNGSFAAPLMFRPIKLIESDRERRRSNDDDTADRFKKNHFKFFWREKFVK
jgi:hypothetical protein